MRNQIAEITDRLRKSEERLADSEAELKRAQPEAAKDRQERDPEGRGGRPRETGENGGEGGAAQAQKRPRRTLLARRNGGGWHLYVECDDPSRERTEAGISSVEGLKEIEQGIYGPVENPEQLQAWAEGEPLVFRITGEHSARRARKPSRGLYFALVPSDWRPVGLPNEPPPVEPEDFGIPGYRMHYFSADRGLPLVFKMPDGDRREISRTDFRLDGDFLADAEERMGPLFTGTPPKLVADAGGLKRVTTVVIGDEGHGEKRWKESFDCQPMPDGQWPLPGILQDRGVGWYFLRLYDPQSHLIESFAFRYASGLQAVRARKPNSGRGNGEAISVEFVHDSEIQVRLLDEIPGCEKQQKSTTHPLETGFEWAPDPQIRSARFEVSDVKGRVPIAIDVDRLWWRLMIEDNPGNEILWQVNTILVTVNDFDATSDIELQLRFPRPVGARAWIGFERAAARPLPAPDREGVTWVRLHEFSEASELTKAGQYGLYVWSNEGGAERRQVLLTVSVPAGCRWCETRGLSLNQLVDHVLDEHGDELFEKLWVHREAEAAPSHPKVAYVCNECGWVCFDEHLPEERTDTALYEHFDRDHGERSPHWTTLRSSEGIEGIRLQSQKWIWKCRLGSCQGILPPQADPEARGDKIKHLREHHLRQLCAPR